MDLVYRQTMRAIGRRPPTTKADQRPPRRIDPAHVPNRTPRRRIPHGQRRPHIRFHRLVDRRRQ